MERKPGFQILISQLVENNAGDLISCPICTNVLWKPVACETCENHFCESCIQKWLSVNKESMCPNQCNFKVRKPQPILLNLLSQLRVKCENESLGCNKTVPYEEIEKHSFSCFETLKVKCEGCGLVSSGAEYRKHIEICELIIVECELCHSKLKRVDLLKNHSEAACMKIKLDALEKDVKLLREDNIKKNEILSKIVEFLTAKHHFDLAYNVNEKPWKKNFKLNGNTKEGESSTLYEKEESEANDKSFDKKGRRERKPKERRNKEEKEFNTEHQGEFIKQGYRKRKGDH